MQRYLRHFAIPVAIVIGLAIILGAIFEPISGDLTRIGEYAERDFGWNAEQPVIRVRANGLRVADPDVLVLGDSFSAGNLWQSELATKLNLRTQSFRYDQTDCVAGWLQYALHQPSARIVAVETVERAYILRFADLVECAAKNPVAFELPPSETAATRANWPPELHIAHTFHTALNTLRMRMSNGTLAGTAVINAPVRNNCAKFSSQRANRLLYFTPDDYKLLWTQEQMARAATNLQRVQTLFAARGKKFVFILVPDKSSAYRDCLLNDQDREVRKRINPTQMLIAAGVNTPDLMSVFQENVSRIVDLYLPNDTHLSPAGFVLMAKQLEPLFADKSASIAAGH